MWHFKSRVPQQSGVKCLISQRAFFAYAESQHLAISIVVDGIIASTLSLISDVKSRDSIRTTSCHIGFRLIVFSLEFKIFQAAPCLL